MHSTIFWYCNDVEPMREFYTTLLGLKEAYYRNDDQAGWLSYESGTLQVVFIRNDETIPKAEGWAKQPGYAEGNLNVPSWVIQLPYEAYDDVIVRVKESDTVILKDEVLEHEGHKAFWVQDPMGTTLELHAQA